MPGSSDYNSDHPSKRQRSDDDERFQNKSKLAAPPAFISKPPTSSQPYSLPSTLSRPSSTGPTGPTLQHPIPQPPAGNGLQSLSSAASAAQPRSDNVSPAINAASAPARGSKEGSKESEKSEFDPETVTKDLKKEGSDWMTMFNPNVQRVLDVGLVHTLIHDSYVVFSLRSSA